MNTRPDVVSAEEWQRTRDELLVTEKELTRAADALAARRRRQQDWEDSPPGWPQYPTYG